MQACAVVATWRYDASRVHVPGCLDAPGIRPRGLATLLFLGQEAGLTRDPHSAIRRSSWDNPLVAWWLDAERMRVVEPASAPEPIVGAGQFTALFRWFRPYLRGSGRMLSFTLVATVVVLACQAVIPLQVDSILSGDGSRTQGLLILVGLALLQMIGGFVSRVWGADVSTDATYRLRLDVFRQLLYTSFLRRQYLSIHTRRY